MSRGPSKHRLSCHCAKRNMLDFRTLTLPSPSEEALCPGVPANIVCPAIVQSENMIGFRSLTLPSPSEEALCLGVPANIVCPAIVQSETCLILGV